MPIVAVTESGKKINILSPIGGFGNHVRWLMLLDPAYQFFYKGHKDAYNNQKGPDWPDYDDYKQDHWNNTPQEIKEEILSIFDDHICIDAVSKTKFIQEKIYHKHRTWSNWLITEWKYRNSIKQLIDFCHSESELENPLFPTLILTIDPDLAYRSYLKFNSYLNKQTVDEFKKSCVDTIEKNLSLEHKNQNTLVLDADVLFQDTLDKDFYKKIIDFFELSNQYETANFIHNLWYQAHKRSEYDIVRDLSNIYK